MLGYPALPIQTVSFQSLQAWVLGSGCLSHGHGRVSMESNPLGLYNSPSPILLLFAMKYLSLLGCTAALISFADAAVAKSPAEIEAIARATSIEIQRIGTDKVGSGVIIHRQGNLYTLITNRHVACGSRSCRLPAQQIYQLGTSDGQRHRVPVTSVKLMGGDLDLAIVQFRSNRSYPVAQVAEPGSLKVNDDVYTAGFPRGQGWLFGSGQAQAVVNRRLVGDGGGYTVVYDAETLPGMSGGGAFDRDGRLVAVHGYGDRFTKNTLAEEVASNTVKKEVNSKIGYNRGIPVRWVVQGLGELGILVGNRQPLSQIRVGNPTVAATADEFFIAGFNKLVEPGQDFQAGRRESIAQFNQAVVLNPRYTTAYLLRAIVKYLLNDPQGALADYNQVISLNPKLTKAYYNRGFLKDEKLNDPQGALADYNQVISLNPKDADAYNNRGLLKNEKLNDPQGALADYNQSISLNPKSAVAYVNRGILKDEKLNDTQGALADYNQAIFLNPKLALAYDNRGNLKTDKLNDPQGALADFDQAISLNPKYATAHNNRGILKFQKLNDTQGALADFNQAISLNPNYATAYMNRGNLKVQELDDAQGALADYNQAISLNPKYASAYMNRGILKTDKLNDPQGALADYNQAISFNPNYATAHMNRGNLKVQELNDAQGALADYNQAISLNPKLANAYMNRGVLKVQKLNDTPGAIADFRTAAKLFRAQGQTQYLQIVLERLRVLGATENP
jgi:tetratricopeptide (TPR) repeat protein/S1-C subfamily serine protease